MKRTDTTQQLTFRPMNVLPLVFGHLGLRHLLLTFLLCLLGYAPAVGQGTWQLYGDTVSSQSVYNPIELEIDTFGALYYKYDSLVTFNTAVAVIKKNNGSGWVTLSRLPLNTGVRGVGFSKLCIVNANLYLLVGSYHLPDKCVLSLRKYNNITGSWGGYPSLVDTISADIDNPFQYNSSNNPYSVVEVNQNYPIICYRSWNGTYSQPKVKMFDGQNWVELGTATLDPAVRYLRLTNANNNLYVNYMTGSNVHVVKRYSWTTQTWANVGTIPSFGLTGTLSSDPQGALYYYAVDANEGRLMKYNGTTWAYVSNPIGVSLPQQLVKPTQVAFDTSGFPHIAVSTNQILKLSGTSWVNYPLLPISVSGNLDSLSPKMIFDKQNSLFVANHLGKTVDNKVGVVHRYASGAPNVTITASSDTVCPFYGDTMTATATGFTGPVTYSWYPSNWVSCNTCLQAVGTAMLPATTFWVVASDGTNTDTAWYTIYKPSVEITPNGGFCSGAANTFTAVPSNAGLSPTYTWKLNSIVVGTGPTYTTTASASNGTLVVTIDPSNISCSNIFHLGDTLFTWNIVSAIRDTIYQSIAQGQSYQGYSASGIYIDTFALSGGCDSIRTLFLSVNGSLNISISSPDTVCYASPVALTANTTGITGTLTYTWTYTNGIGCLNCQTTTINRLYVTTTVKVVVSNGTIKDSITKTIYVSNLSNSVDIIMPSQPAVCEFENQTYTAVLTTPDNAISFRWEKNGVLASTSPTYTTNLRFGDNIFVYLVGPYGTCPLIYDSVPFANLQPTNGDVALAISGNVCNNTAELLVSGVSPLAQIEWQRNGTTIATVTSPNQGVTVAGGNGNGSANNQFGISVGVAVDASGNVYVSDAANHRVMKWAPGATAGIAIAGGNGSGGAANQLKGPTDIFLDGAGNIYVADPGNYRVMKWALGATSGVAVAGNGVVNNMVNYLTDVYVDAYGNVYVVDANNERIQKWPAGGGPGVLVAGDGFNTASNSIMNFPNKLSIVDSTFYVLDKVTYQMKVIKWNFGASTGTLIPNILNNSKYFESMVVDHNLNVYLGGGSGYIEKWVPGATYPTIVAGRGTGANQLGFVTDIFLNTNGDLYLVDYSNFKVEKWTQTPLDTTFSIASSGTYTAVVTMPWGCKVTSNPIVVNAGPLLDTIYQSIALGQNYNGYTASGTYIDTFATSGGCDSIRVLFLSVVSCTNVQDTIYQSILQGQNYQGYTANGIYIDTFALPSGCDSIRTLVLVVTPNTNVWPGDANSDGVANMNDALAIGLAYNVVGPVRPNATNNWSGQPSPPWMTTFGNSINHHHADCTGNGQIDANDTVPILLNYNLTHLKDDNSRQSGSPILYFMPALRNVPTNTRVYVPVALGLAPDSAANVSGIAFSINYDQTLVVPGSMYFEAVNSWLGDVGNDLFYIQKPLPAGVLDAAISRNDHTNRTGLGTIGVVSFITIDNISGKDSIEAMLQLGFSNVTMISNDGTVLPVDFASDSLIISQEVGIGETGAMDLQVLLYPNPAQGNISYAIQGLIGWATLRITDITGRVVQEAELQAQGKLDISVLSQGVYFFRIHTASGQIVKKIVLE
ncbi:hypothetical protein BH09BAC1_BH09BAC1_08620 [soil metagenome]